MQVLFVGLLSKLDSIVASIAPPCGSHAKRFSNMMIKENNRVMIKIEVFVDDQGKVQTCDCTGAKGKHILLFLSNFIAFN